MNLTSDLPFWTVRDGLLRVYPAVEKDLRCDALVVGGGISGALLARQLTRRGVDCIVVDRRDIGSGSTSASTALLQYEIDTPLRKLRTLVGDKAAERAYWAGVESILRLARFAGKDTGFAPRPSLQVVMKHADLAGLKTEFALRRSLGFPVRWLDRAELRADGIQAEGALRSKVAAEVDPYRLTHRLLHLAVGRGLRVFDRTTAVNYSHSGKHVVAKTDRGHRIRCRAVFFASGYETQEILTEKVVRFRSTYAFVSEPVDGALWWKDRR